MTGYYLLDHRQGRPTWYTSRRKPLRVIVVHITAGLEDLDGADSSAERTARYAATTDRAVSWHSGSDSDSFLHLLPASYTAFHCRDYNSFSFGHEISKATTRWTGMPQAWVDRTLANAAACLRPITEKYHIPYRRLTKAEVDAGAYGFAAHADLDPTRRSDPGADFPWSQFFALMQPTPPPTAKAGPDVFIVKDPESNRQYLTDGLIRRHIRTLDALNAWKAAGVPVITLDPIEFAAIKESA